MLGRGEATDCAAAWALWVASRPERWTIGRVDLMQIRNLASWAVHLPISTAVVTRESRKRNLRNGDSDRKIRAAQQPGRISGGNRERVGTCLCRFTLRRSVIIENQARGRFPLTSQDVGLGEPSAVNR